MVPELYQIGFLAAPMLFISKPDRIVAKHTPLRRR